MKAILNVWDLKWKEMDSPLRSKGKADLMTRRHEVRYELRTLSLFHYVFLVTTLT